MDKKGIFNSLRSEAGSTLIYVLMGVSIMSVVGFTAAHVAADARKAEFMGDITNSLNQVHLISIQQSRNSTLLRAALKNAGFNLDTGSPESRCLSAAGTNCQNHAVPTFALIPEWSGPVKAVVGQSIVNNVEFRVLCSTPTACETVQVRVTTELADRTLRRTTDLRVSGTLLGELPELSFSCVQPSDRFITAVDFRARQALCQGIPVTTDCGGRPLADLDAGSNPSCASMAMISCAQGLKSVGLMNMQGACL